MNIAQKTGDKTLCELVLEGGDALGAFFPWFQGGVWITVPPRTTVAELLIHHWGLDRETVEKHVGTLLLNGTPLDDMALAFLGDGDVLALSGPMPGLAGAVLRKKSPLAGLRHGPRPRMIEAMSTETTASVRVRVKLFNRLIAKLGPMLLKKGIVLERKEAVQCLRDWKVSTRPKPEHLWLNNKEVSLTSLDFNHLSTCALVAFRTIKKDDP